MHALWALVDTDGCLSSSSPPVSVLSRQQPAAIRYVHAFMLARSKALRVWMVVCALQAGTTGGLLQSSSMRRCSLAIRGPAPRLLLLLLLPRLLLLRRLLAVQMLGGCPNNS